MKELGEICGQSRTLIIEHLLPAVFDKNSKTADKKWGGE
jgi:hypothetical protein